jgi:GTP-binding protein Era
MDTKAGFVNIIGNPNVGKSTLLNALLGQKLAITTPKAQTTRHRILGILNRNNTQMVFSDTPGVIQPAYALQEAMMGFVKSALEDADVFLYLVEPGEKELKDPQLLHFLQNTPIPVLLCINKVDTTDQTRLEDLNAHWKSLFPNAEVIPISALEKFNLDYLLHRIEQLLPNNPFYYAADALTDRQERFFVAEIIREKILLYYQKEIPYAVEVVVEEFLETASPVHIRAVIYVARESQKGILIGHRGAALTKVGTEARKDIETFLDTRVFLELYVKVNKDWRDDATKLKRLGYRG